MNRQDDSSCGILGVDRGPPSPLDSLVCALLGRRVVGLRVEVRDGGLVLHGRAASYHAKQLAQHAAMAVTDLPLIANKIEVVCHRRGAARPDGAEYPQGEAGPARTRVLLATGDDQLRSAGRTHLTDRGHVVATATGGVECLTRIREFAPAVVVLDTDLLWGGADGVLEHLRAGDSPSVPAVLLTSPFATPRGAGSGVGPPVVLVLEKPVGVGTLLWAVWSVVGGGSIARPGGWPAAGEEAPPPPA
jgi:CheY-like chemotaxis protein